MFTRSVLAATLLLGAALGLADPPVSESTLDIQAMLQMAGGAAPAGAAGSPDKPFPDFAEVTKGMRSKPGLFTLWTYPPEEREKDGEKLLCQIPAGFLGEQFMLSTSISGGGFMTGFPLEESVVRWEILGNQLLLIQPQTSYVVDNSREVSDVVKRTYPERIRAATPILTKSPAGDPVIDLGALLKGNFSDLSWASMSGGPFGMPGFGAPQVNAALSRWTKRKTFELNVEIGVELAIGSSGQPGAFDKKMMHYSFWKLPQTDYAPRAADERVGYFLATNQDWAKPVDARELFNRYVTRWNLVKRDPSLASCEPRQPIIFYIEKTVPVRFRRAVRDGILEWNKAFEKVGFVNAVEVRQQTDDNEWKDLDPEDMRYSFFRWIVTGAGFAMGPSRANPFTGQIYDADIIFDDSMVRFYEHEAGQMLPAALAFQHKLDDPLLRKFFRQYPAFLPAQRDWEYAQVGERDLPQMRAALQERMERFGLHGCDYSRGMKHQVQLGQTLLAGQPREVLDRFLYDVVKEVVMHEVGHTLGLRHNFIASTVYSLEEIEKRRKTGDATVGSVMDYNPALFFNKDATAGHFITPTIGPYDFWAIEYGYRPFDPSAAAPEPKSESDKDPNAAPKGPTQASAEQGAAGGTNGASAGGPAKEALSAAGGMVDEQQMLASIASRSTLPELAYATDEDTTYVSPDPRNNRFDCGKDPIDWARTRIELCDERMTNILEWAVKDKEAWYHLAPAFSRLVLEKMSTLEFVGRYVGGQYFNRARRGDPDAAPPFAPVDVATQRKALEFLVKHALSESAYTFDARVLNHLAPSRWWHEGSDVSFTMDFPVIEMVSSMQWNALFDRLFPNTLRRIQDAELKTPASNRLTAAEYIQRVHGACWAEAADPKRAAQDKWTDETPCVPLFRRTLQREYLAIVEPMLRLKPGDALPADLHAMLSHSLRLLSGQLGEALKAKLDFASAAHFTECKSRIDRILSAELRESESGGMSMSPFGQTSGR